MRRISPFAVVLVVGAMVLAACGSGAKPAASSHAKTANGKPVSGGTVTFAEQPGSPPDFIFPMTPLGESGGGAFDSDQFVNLLYPPLVWPGYDGNNAVVDKTDSVFKSIVYSNGDKTVTITLKNWNWSDGKPVTSRDLEFWMNLLDATKQFYISYVPGQFPANVVSYRMTGEKTFVLRLNAPYNENWFTEDELEYITPIPQHVWDKESPNGKVGNYDMTPAGAKKVYNFIVSQAKVLSKYATNPLWKVVDGAWKIHSFNTTGYVELVPNPRYSGPKPHLAKLEELPFTSSIAELNALRSGTIDVGYLPYSALSERSSLEAHGFRFEPFYGAGNEYIDLNFTNPRVGPLLKQLYVRQALQHLIDQPAIIKGIYHGLAGPEYGYIATLPKTKYLSPLGERGLYHYSVKAAKSLLANHGWRVVPNGTDVCDRPGTGAGHCGAGVMSGEKLSLNLLYTSGLTTMDEQDATFKSDASQAGITINLRAEPFDSVNAAIIPCAKPSCWQLGDFGGDGLLPVPIPTDYTPGSGLNDETYNNPVVTKEIQEVAHSGSLSLYYKMEDTLIRQAVMLWVPNYAFELSLVKSNLKGVLPLDPSFYINPQAWYYMK